MSEQELRSRQQIARAVLAQYLAGCTTPQEREAAAKVLEQLAAAPIDDLLAEAPTDADGHPQGEEWLRWNVADRIKEDAAAMSCVLHRMIAETDPR